MAINFPVGLDDPLATFIDGTTVAESARLQNITDAVEALEVKVGINASAVATSHDYLLANLPIYVDRGDPAAYDYAVGDFVTDGTWNDKDISGIVGVGSRLVHFGITITDDATTSVFRLRENGNANTINTTFMETSAVNLALHGDVWCMTDAAGVVEYWGSNLAFTVINVIIRGWYVLD